MYLIAACSLTLRPLLSRIYIPFDFLRAKLGYGQLSRMTGRTKTAAPSGANMGPGFIQMDDRDDTKSKSGKSRIGVLTTTTVVFSDAERGGFKGGEEARY